MRPIDSTDLTWESSICVFPSGEPNVDKATAHLRCAMEEYALRVCRPWAEKIFQALMIAHPSVYRANHMKDLDGSSCVELYGYDDFELPQGEDRPFESPEYKDLKNFCEKVFDFTGQELGGFKR